MEEILKQILAKLDKVELDVATMKNGVSRLDKMELDVAAIKNDIRQVDKKADNITDAVAKVMEDITELKGKVEKQDVEIRVIKGGK